MRNSKKDNEEKSFINIIFTTLLVIALIFILIYVFSKEYRYSVNKDISQIFKVDMNEKTKFLDNLFTNKEKNKEIIKENNEKDEDKNFSKETDLIKENNKNVKVEKETTEKVKEKTEIIKEKTPEEKALELVNEKYNKNGVFMSYIMNKNNENEYLVGLSDPKTTNLKAAYIVNVKDGSIKDMK